MSRAEPDVDFTELHKVRAKKTIKLMEKLGLDAIVVTTTDNIRYTSDWRPAPLLTELYNDEFASISPRTGTATLSSPPSWSQ